MGDKLLLAFHWQQEEVQFLRRCHGRYNLNGLCAHHSNFTWSRPMVQALPVSGDMLLG